MKSAVTLTKHTLCILGTGHKVQGVGQKWKIHREGGILNPFVVL